MRCFKMLFRATGNVAAGTFEVSAGAVLVEKPPLGRLGRVIDIASMAVFPASDE
jgi:hypothetical protein